jgi:hypothetical protein
MVAFMPEPQTLFTVVAAQASGRPALRMAWRAGACFSPALITLPMITSSTRSAATSVESSAARMA